MDGYSVQRRGVNIAVVQNALGTLEKLLDQAKGALTQIEAEAHDHYENTVYDNPESAMESYLEQLQQTLLVVLETAEMPETRASLVTAWAAFKKERDGLTKIVCDDFDYTVRSLPLTYAERVIQGLRISVGKELWCEEGWILNRLETILRDTAALVRRRGISPSNELDVQAVMHDYLRVGFPGFVPNPPIRGALKTFKPDCGIRSVSAAIEFKIVHTEEDVAVAFSGIAEDAAGYQGSKDWTRFYAVFYQAQPFILASEICDDMKRIRAKFWIPILVNGPMASKALRNGNKKPSRDKKRKR